MRINVKNRQSYLCNIDEKDEQHKFNQNQSLYITTCRNIA